MSAVQWMIFDTSFPSRSQDLWFFLQPGLWREFAFSCSFCLAGFFLLTTWGGLLVQLIGGFKASLWVFTGCHRGDELFFPVSPPTDAV